MRTKNYNSVGVIGAGFVGNAVIQNLKKSLDIKVYDIDPSKANSSLKKVVSENVVFCCLPTNMLPDGTQDFKPYKELFNEIRNWSLGDTIFVIKSTVLYSNIMPYLKKFRIVMNPEFLNANSAVKDFAEQKMIILGGDPIDMKEVQDMYNQCFNSYYGCDYEYLSHEDAINIKYIHNIYHAYKVLFWNFVHEKTGNSRLYAKMYKGLREGLDNELSQISPDGKLGYGGACFPKDVNAMGYEFPHEMLEYMKKFNERLRNGNKGEI